MREFDGSSRTSTPPVESLTNSTFCHVLPPSTVRKMPRSGCGPYACPSAATSTRSGSVGSIAMRAMRPVFSSPTVRPRFSGVGRLVHPPADRDVAPYEGFARSHPHDVRIGRRDRDSTDRGDGHAVEHRIPVRPRIDRLPEPTARRPGVVDVRVALHAGDRVRPIPLRPDVSIVQRGQRDGVGISRVHRGALARDACGIGRVRGRRGNPPRAQRSGCRARRRQSGPC